MNGAAARTAARRPCDGTATITCCAPDRASSSAATGSRESGKRHIGQVRGIGAATRHFLDERRVAPPERHVLTGTAELNGECRAPASCTQDRCLVLRPRLHLDDSTGRRAIDGPSRARRARIAGGSSADRRRIGRLARAPSGPASAMATVPTGFSADPPSGPATPVILTPSSVPKRCRTPSAIARATGSLTAPCSASMSSGTPSSRVFTVLSYAITPPANHAELPGTSVRRPPSRPPVQDSATAMRAPFASSASPTTRSSARPSVLNTAGASAAARRSTPSWSARSIAGKSSPRADRCSSICPGDARMEVSIGMAAPASGA